MRDVVVTGASGFVGSNLVRRLCSEGWNVHVIVRQNSKLDQIASCLPQINVHIHDGTTSNLIEILRSTQPRVIFHLASLFLAQHKPDDVEALINSNLLFSTQLAEAMVETGVKYLVNTGTSWQHYENQDYNPVNLYAATKQAFESVLSYYVEARGLKVTTLVLFDTYGPGDPRAKLMSLLCKAASSQTALAMSPGEQFIDLVHIDDVTNAYLMSFDALQEQAENHSRYAVSSGNPLRLIDLVKRVEIVTGKSLAVQWGSRPYRPREVMSTWSNFNSIPGWQPRIPLDTGIRQLWSELLKRESSLRN